MVSPAQNSSTLNGQIDMTVQVSLRASARAIDELEFEKRPKTIR
jgi:hypothetical protein